MANLIPKCIDQSTGRPTRPGAADSLVAVDGSPLSGALDYIEYNQVGESTQSVPTSTVVIFEFNNQVTDSDSNVTTGSNWRYTVPADGILFVHFGLRSTDATPSWAASEAIDIAVYVDGSIRQRAGWQWGGQGTAGQVLTGTAILDVSQNDEISLRGGHSSGNTTDFGPSTADEHFITMALLPPKG